MADTLITLTEDEERVLPTVVAIIGKIHQDHPLTSSVICDMVRGTFALRDFRGQFNDQRLRKFVNYIRVNGILPVVSCGANGYCVTRDPELVQKQIDSMNGRIYKMERAVRGLRSFLEAPRQSNLFDHLTP